ncbi:MAG: hypothetical protein IT538_08780 [Variibacter sp.]|nr:hypothetical protein [Variibacter sp.]
MATNKKGDEGRARREAQASDGAAAKAAYHAEADALRARTEKLRALRLAKEAAELAAGKAAPAGRAAKRGNGGKTAEKSKGKGKSMPLSEWLDSENKSGRRS